MQSKLIYHMGVIKAHFAYKKKRLFYPTMIKVSPESVDAKCFIKPKAESNWKNLNEQILIHKKRLDDAITLDLRVHGDIDIDRIKITLFNQDQKEPRALVNKAQEWLSFMLEDFLSNQPKMNRGLRWRFELLMKIIVADDRICGQIKTPYLHELLNKFREGVNANTGSTRFKNFKRFITWCQENGYPIPKIEWKRLSNPTFKPDFVFLTDEKIQQLIQYQPKTNFEEKVKNILLVLVYTGMRYSDYLSFHPNEIHNGYIDKVAHKTRTRFKVPVNKLIEPILKDAPKMAGQVFNKGVKDLGREIGWIEMVRYQKDIKEFVMVPFHEMLCSSVGRHTFATRALLAGVPHNIIMGWCGWSNSAMLFYYSERLKIQTIDWMEKIK